VLLTNSSHVDLQQTEFNIPHLVHRSLACGLEGTLRPAGMGIVCWRNALRRNVAQSRDADGALSWRDRAKSGTSPNCQSMLYADYMVERAGEESLVKLLDAYRRQLKTPAAIQEVFGVDLAAFEAGYLKFLQQTVAGLDVVEPREDPQTPAEFSGPIAKLRIRPRRPAAMPACSGWLRRGRKRISWRSTSEGSSRSTAGGLCGPGPPSRRRTCRARSRSSKGARPERPPAGTILSLLLEIQLAGKEAGRPAAELCELGRRKFPRYPDWWAGGRPSLWLRMTGRTETALQSLLPLEPDDPIGALEAGRIRPRRRDARAARAYARDSLLIDVLDAETHRFSRSGGQAE